MKLISALLILAPILALSACSTSGGGGGGSAAPHAADGENCSAIQASDDVHEIARDFFRASSECGLTQAQAENLAAQM